MDLAAGARSCGGITPLPPGVILPGVILPGVILPGVILPGVILPDRAGSISLDRDYLWG